MIITSNGATITVILKEDIRLLLNHSADRAEILHGTLAQMICSDGEVTPFSLAAMAAILKYSFNLFFRTAVHIELRWGFRFVMKIVKLIQPISLP